MIVIIARLLWEPLIRPLGILAEDVNERIKQMRCVLHASPP